MTDSQAPDVVVTASDLVVAGQMARATSSSECAMIAARYRLSTQSSMRARIEELEAQIAEAIAHADVDPTEISRCADAVYMLRATLSNIGGSNDG